MSPESQLAIKHAPVAIAKSQVNTCLQQTNLGTIRTELVAVNDKALMNTKTRSRGLTGARPKQLLRVVVLLGCIALMPACQQQKSEVAAASLDDITDKSVSVESGERVYYAYCGSCHGLDGKGNGPAAAALRTAPADLTQLSKRNRGAFPAQLVHSMAAGDYAIAAHGSKEMPIWGPAFLSRSGRTAIEVENNIRALVRYIELLQKDLVAKDVQLDRGSRYRIESKDCRG